jgi:hypothetical protein
MHTTRKWKFYQQSRRPDDQRGISTGDTAGDHIEIGSAGQLLTIIENLLSIQRLAVLSSQQNGAPYGNLVAFASADELARLIFVTPRATRKFSNILYEPRVAMVVDNRSNDSNDFSKAIAVTAIGRAIEADLQERDRLRGAFLSKHPYLEDFAQAPDSAIVAVNVQTYYCVYRFQNVMELHLES